MRYETLTIDKKDRLATISLVGPWQEPDRIAILSQELAEVCQDIAWDEDIWVAMILGAGQRPFAMAPLAPSSGREGSPTSWPLAAHIADLDIPVIAAMEGEALGQGLELLLACDIRICAESASFGLPQIKGGLLPADGGTQRLARIVGGAKALEMILTGESIGAKQALGLGLVSQVVPAAELAETVMALARAMTARAPIALRYGKEALTKGLDLSLAQGLRLEADLYLLLHTTKDRTEGITAFRQKKPPAFVGE